MANRKRKVVTDITEDGSAVVREVDDGTQVSGLSADTTSDPPDWAKEKPKEDGREASITIPVKNGRFDLDSLRKKTLDRYHALRVATHGDAAQSGTQTVPDNLKEIMVVALFGIWEAAEVAALSRKYPPQIVKNVFHYTPEQLNMLKEPTLAVINKYFPRLDKWGPEAAFLMAFSMDQFMKFQAMQELISRMPQVVEVRSEHVPDTPPPVPPSTPQRPDDFTTPKADPGANY